MVHIVRRQIMQAVSGPGIAFLNFELMWLVSLCIAAAFWLEKDEFAYA